MNVEPIVKVANLIGEAGRIRMLSTLLDGNGHSASELAITAAVSPQTASSHLSKLLSGGLVVSERQGRQRLFRLKNRDVAAAIEALGALAYRPEMVVLPQIRFARTCYDHLAGVLAIAVRNELLSKGAIRHRKGAFILTSAGSRLLRTLDIDVDALRGLRRSFAHKCLDWTERHHHIGGAVGAALLSCFFERNWLARVRGARAVRVTHAGEHAFEKVFGIRCAALRAGAAVRAGNAEPAARG
jgi:DNA-binding transcriptional ArsR family regulator